MAVKFPQLNIKDQSSEVKQIRFFRMDGKFASDGPTDLFEGR